MDSKIILENVLEMFVEVVLIVEIKEFVYNKLNQEIEEKVCEEFVFGKVD